MARKPTSSLRDGRRAKRAARGVARASQAYSGVVRGQISDLQRARIIAATFEVCSERGAANATVAHVVERSGVSRRTFYEIFSSWEDCFLAAFEQALSYATERVLPAYETGKTWREKIRGGLIALLSFLDEEPAIGRLLVVESFSGGPEVLACRAEVLGRLVEALEQTQARATGGVIPPLTGEGLIGGVLSVLHSRLAENDHAPLLALTNPLMNMIVLPYQGSVAARRELERSMPEPAGGLGKTTTLSADPFKAAGMRLTYRTVRVLVAIDDLDGRGINPSNRSIGDAAEMADQGQTSKLLTRLKGAGMIANTEPTPGKGMPNSWALTPSGQKVVSTIRTHTEGRGTGAHER